jgi:Arc/MetJ family transcription regulator
MRTNVVLDDQLMDEAFHYANVATKRELIDLALREFIANRKRRDIRLLQGKASLRADYDYQSLRQNRHE